MQILGLDFTELANAILALLVALVGLASVWIGRKAKKAKEEEKASEPPPVAVKGAAIVSSQSIEDLTRTILAANEQRIAAVEHRNQMMGATKSLIDAAEDLTREIQSLRIEIMVQNRNAR